MCRRGALQHVQLLFSLVSEGRMDAIKGLARRATQSLREKVSNADSTNDDKLNEVTKKVRNMEKSAVTLSDKVLRAAKLIEELGAVMRDIGEEYKQCPDLSSETQQLADDTVSFGATLVQKAQEHQAPLKEHAFDLLGNFIKDLHKLRDTEEDRKKKQLEYDFFRQKVLELRKSPPKDFTRIPRNEQILENWRTELWKSTEANKSVASTLYAQGQRAIDQSVLTVGQVLSSFLNIAASGAKHSYSNARLPLYPTAPILTPAPLPPNPLPPFQYPNTSGAPPAAVTYTPSGQDYSSPNPHQSQQQWNPSHQPTGQQQPWQHQQQRQQPQQYNQQPPPQQQHQQPPMQQQQQQQLPAAWAQPQQPQQHQQPQHDVPQWATTQQQPVWQPPPQQHQAQHDQAVPHQHPPSQPTSVSSRADSQHSPPPQAATAPVEAQPTAPEAQHAS